MISKLQLAALSLTAACSGLSPIGTVEDLPSELRAKAPDSLWRSLVAQESRSFIVELSTKTDDKSLWAANKAALMEIAPSSEAVVEKDWDSLPLVQVHAATMDAALAMLDREEAAAAYEVEHYQLSDAESFPLIDQPAAAAAGKIGEGTSVAVLDTGADYTRADFGSCTAPGVPSTCKVAYAQDFATNDNSLDDNGHGTNVSGIVVGVAPGAKVLALDVFNGESASSTDIISAINWAISNQKTYNIASMNLSLGGGSYTALCTSDAMGTALGQARKAGIAPVVASGNSATTNAVSSPACAPAAISVGAVYDSNVGGLRYSNCTDATTAADQIACFSNSASFLSVLAPGALITAAGYTMAGTSQATPHVAGALAVLHAAYPTETVDQQVARLTSTGKKIKDARNSVTTPRIDLYAALGAPAQDVTPPTGGVTINSGAVFTKSASVSLAITGSDDGGVAQMCVTNTTTCTAYETFAASKTWTLAAGDGKKTVTVFLRDKAGNTTTATTSPSATITLDATAPAGGSVTVTPGNAQIVLKWSGFTDAGSGVASYRVVSATGATAPANCTGTTVWTGSDSGATVSATNGTTYSFRVCAVDKAGNISTGVTASAAAKPEANPPVGSFKINGGAAQTKSRAVTLTLSATDDTKVAQMCIADGTSCTAYVAYATTASFTFAADGQRTLHVWFRDTWGNTSAPVDASILVDTIAPTGGVLSATASSGKVALSWTAATDAGTGFASYKLVAASGSTAPAASCTNGTVLFTGTDTSFSHTVAAKSVWSYRLCAIDNIGNVSAGTTKTLTAPAQ